MKQIIIIILTILSLALGHCEQQHTPERQPFPSYDYNAGQ